MQPRRESKQARSPLGRLNPRNWVGKAERWDPVGWILVAHGVILVGLGDTARPPWVLGITLGLGLWRLVIGATASRRGASTDSSLIVAREAGSLMLAIALVYVDGGTESPFFFWPLVLLAWEALRLRTLHLEMMVGVTVVGYLGVVLLVPDITAASMARLGLLLAFGAVLVSVRLQIDLHKGQAEQSERLLRDAFAAAPVGLLVVSAEDRSVLQANTAAEAMRLSERLAEGGDNTLSRLVHAAWQGRRTAGPKVVELQGDEDADPRYIRLIATPHDAPGSGMVIIGAEDVTSQVRVGEERRRFLRFAGHQLRTPLTPVIAYSELMRSGELTSEETRAAAEEVHTSARRLLRLCERMLAVADIQTEAQKTAVATRVGEVLAHVGAEMMADVVTSGDNDLEIVCNAELVAQALAELLDNSHRFGEPPIHLEWSADNADVEFRVWDAGPGPDMMTSKGVLFADWGKVEARLMMTPEMGSRLGLIQARLLADLSDGELTLRRSGADWVFALRLLAPGLTEGLSGAWAPSGELAGQSP